MTDFSYQIAENIYGTYCVPLSSSYTFTSRAILNGKIHEPETIAYILKNVKDGDVIHSGACFGDFLPALSKLKTSVIWAFEPNEENFTCAKRTVEMNGLKNVKLMHLALGELNSICSLKIMDADMSLGPRSRIIKSNSPLPSLETEMTNMRTLDSLIPSSTKVSLIHLDTEGYESFIIQGARGIIARDEPLIILEIDSEDLHYDHFMSEIDYFPIKHLVYEYDLKVFKNTVYKKVDFTLL